MSPVSWSDLWAPYATRDIWMSYQWGGKADFGPYLLPDGRDITHLIGDGDLDQLPFPVWFKPFNSGKRLSDLLWTGGVGAKLASCRFVEVLNDIGASGWRAFEVPVLDRTGTPIEGYVGFATTGGGDDLDVSHINGFQNFCFRVKPHVLDALLAAGVDKFKHEPTKTS